MASPFRVLNKVSLLVISTRDSLFLDFSFRSEYFTKGHVSSYFLSLSSSPKSKKAGITSGPFALKVQPTSDEAYSADPYQ